MILNDLIDCIVFFNYYLTLLIFIIQHYYYLVFNIIIIYVPRYTQVVEAITSSLGDSDMRHLSKEERLHATYLLMDAALRHANASWERRVAQLRHLTHHSTQDFSKVRRFVSV